MSVAANDYDVVIVGSGAGGGTSAYALATKGLRVLLLEAGPHYHPLTDYPLSRPDWELQNFPDNARSKARYHFATAQLLDSRFQHLRSRNELLGNYNPTHQRLFANYHHVRGVGGTTLHFSAEAHRLHPHAMQLQTRFGVGADWPLSYEDLEPFYGEVENIVGVAGPEKTVTRPRSSPYPLPPHQLSYASQKLQVGCKQLGWHWEENSVAILSRPYAGRPACNYCANCNRGCPRGDKGSVDVTFIAQALATQKCILKADSPVVNIEVGDNDKVVAVQYQNADGSLTRVKTPILILSCGAIETPRLLLATTSKAAPEGLANENGLVGHHFMETLAFAKAGLHPQPLASQRGIPTDSVCWDFNPPDAIPGIIGGCVLMPAAVSMGFLGPVNYANRVVGGWGTAHKKHLREQFGHVLAVSGMGESLPHPQSYIDLDPQRKDEHGVPTARIHSYLDDLAIHRLDFMAKQIQDLLLASGVEQWVEQYGNYDFFNSTHVFGTCRMGNDPKTSVVDKYCRSHRWRNLFIIDSSVFPSSGGGESPSLTIEALALRTAKYIKELKEK